MKKHHAANATADTEWGGILLWWGCDNYEVSGNYIVGGESNAIYLVGGSGIVKDNRIEQIGDGSSTGDVKHVIRYTNNTDYSDYDVEISNNIIRNVDVKDAIIYISARSNEFGLSGSLRINNNTITKSSGKGIHIDGSSANSVENVGIRGNSITNVEVGINAVWITDAVISDNTISCNQASPSTARYGVWLSAGKDTLISNNQIKCTVSNASYANFGIAISNYAAADTVSINGNILKGCHSGTDGDSDVAISVAGSNSIQVANNVIKKFATGIRKSEEGHQRVRTHGNFLYPGASSGENSGYNWGNEMDTGFMPQVEWYKERTESDDQRYRTDRARFVTTEIAVDVTNRGENLPKAYMPTITPTEIGISSSDIVLWCGASPHTTVENDIAEMVDVVVALSGFPIGEPIGSNNIRVGARVTKSSHDLGGGKFANNILPVTITLLVASTIDIDGAEY